MSDRLRTPLKQGGSDTRRVFDADGSLLFIAPDDDTARRVVAAVNEAEGLAIKLTHEVGFREKAEREAAELRAALERLHADVLGAWSLYEPELRQVIGNTNFAVIQRHLVSASAALKRTEGKS